MYSLVLVYKLAMVLLLTLLFFVVTILAFVVAYYIDERLLPQLNSISKLKIFFLLQLEDLCFLFQLLIFKALISAGTRVLIIQEPIYIVCSEGRASPYLCSSISLNVEAYLKLESTILMWSVFAACFAFCSFSNSITV